MRAPWRNSSRRRTPAASATSTTAPTRRRDDAKRQADHAGTDNARLIAERDGVCRGFIGSGSTEASGAHGASQMMR